MEGGGGTQSMFNKPCMHDRFPDEGGGGGGWTQSTFNIPCMHDIFPDCSWWLMRLVQHMYS